MDEVWWTYSSERLSHVDAFKKLFTQPCTQRFCDTDVDMALVSEKAFPIPISDNPIKEELTSLHGCCCRGTRRRRRCILLLIELFYSSLLPFLFRRLAFDRSVGEKRD